MRRRKAAFKLSIIGLVAVTLVALLGAIAMAQSGPQVGHAPPGTASTRGAVPAARATLAAGALADAHRSDRAVTYLADIAQREVARVSTTPRPGQDQVLNTFSQSAEEHLVSGSRNPIDAQQLLRSLVQQLQGTDAATTSAPVAEAEPREVSAFGRDVVIEADQTVESASVVGGNLTIRGHVLQDAVAIGGNVQLAAGARVDGDTVSVGGNVRLEPGTRVEGDAVSIGGRSNIAQGAYVGGDRTQVGAGTWTRPLVTETNSGGGFGAWLKSTAETIGLGLVMTLLFIVIAAVAPNPTRNVVATVRKRPIVCFISGLLAVIVMVMATAVLFVTVIGIPLIPVLWFAVALAMLFGMTSVSALLGEALPGRNKANRAALRSIVLGVIFLTIVSFIPWGLGFILLGTLMSAALGAVILSRVGAVDPHR